MKEHAQVYCGNCLDVLDDLISKEVQVDAIITDPPFFMPAIHYVSTDSKWKRRFSDTSILGDWFAGIATKANQVLKKEGHFLTFCNSDSYPVFYAAMYPHFDKLKCLVWDKENHGLGRIWRSQHELIIAARKNGHKHKNAHGRGDVLKFKSTPANKRQHPVQKPIDLMQSLIEATTDEGDTVLDLFMGSGSTGMAALNIKRKFIGIELDRGYFDIAKARIEEVNGALMVK